MHKHILKRAVCLLMVFSLSVGILVIPALAGKRATATPNISNAFNKDHQTTINGYADGYGWDLEKNNGNEWTSDITGEDMEWTEGNQLQLYYDNQGTTMQHLWDAAVGGFGGGYGDLGLPDGSGSDIVSVAISQRGVRESPPYSNCVPYVRWFNGWSSATPVSAYKAYEWCCIFVVWCATQCGYVDDGIFKYTGSCTTMFDYMTNTKGYSYCSVQDVWKKRVTSVEPGDIIFFKSSKNSAPRAMGHIGIVVEYNEEENYLLCIEGNTNGSCDPAGVGTRGGGVCYQKYRPTTKYSEMQRGYIVRPKYPSSVDGSDED